MITSSFRHLHSWLQSSILEKSLILAVTLSVICNVVPVASFPANGENNQELCLTPGCVHAASHILDQIDETVEPCEDFYNFACGNFVKETIIPDEKTSVTTFEILNDKLQEQLRSIISEKVDPNDSAPIIMAKQLYNACMNTSRIEEQGLKPMLDILEKLGGWPVVVGDKWNSKWSWIWAIEKLRKIGYDWKSIFSFDISVDVKNSNARRIYIDQAGLSLNREYLNKGLEDKVVKAYYEYMVDVAVIYGADRTRATQDLKESLEFEIKLANISLPIEEQRNATALYNPFTLKEVQEKYPYIQWTEYINALLPSALSVDESEVIIVRVPSYFDKLGKLLANTSNRVIANYMLWRATEFSSSFLTEELRKRQLDYQKITTGKQAREARWKECTEVAKDKLALAVGALYVCKYFSRASKNAALEMMNELNKEFERQLKEFEWMDNETRQAAFNKLEAMASHIGYPDELLDNTKLEEYFQNLEIDENNYLSSVLNINVFEKDYSISKLRQAVNKTDWVSHGQWVAIVNALYAPGENSIQFPAGILQGSFFSADRPRYLNFGAIGWVIGHEITHGFDDEGSQYDPDGNVADWWQPATKERYLEKAQCIINQYGNYTEPLTGLKLNGINTQGENIADNGGIKQSYLAYQKWVNENGPEPKLPGLNYSPQQLFWVSAAQTRCNVFRPETMKNQIISNPHSPGQFRVLGPLSNRPEFANDFNCPIGSPMNPVEKCELW